MRSDHFLFLVTSVTTASAQLLSPTTLFATSHLMNVSYTGSWGACARPGHVFDLLFVLCSSHLKVCITSLKKIYISFIDKLELQQPMKSRSEITDCL